MPNMIEIKNPYDCPNRYNMQTRCSIVKSIYCTNRMAAFPLNCPLPDAPDLERYRVAVELLREAANDLDLDPDTYSKITAFLAGERSADDAKG